jgi:ribonuclease inhibitor
MRKAILNGKRMISREVAHAYLKRKLGFPDYYGRNLDALWDLLTTIHEPVEIRIFNRDSILLKMGEYGERLLSTIDEAAEENPRITVEYCN